MSRTLSLPANSGLAESGRSWCWGVGGVWFQGQGWAASMAGGDELRGCVCEEAGASGSHLKDFRRPFVMEA